MLVGVGSMLDLVFGTNSRKINYLINKDCRKTMKHSESIIKDFLMRLKADKLSLGQFL